MARYSEYDPYPVPDPRDTIAEMLMQNASRPSPQVDTFGGKDISDPLSQEQGRWRDQQEEEERQRRALLVKGLFSNG